MNVPIISYAPERSHALRELCKQRVANHHDLPGRFWHWPWAQAERLAWRAFYCLKTAVCLVLGWERDLDAPGDDSWLYGTVFLDYSVGFSSDWGTVRNWTCVCTGWGLWRRWWYAVVSDGCP